MTGELPAIIFIVSMSVWMTPMARHSEGRLVNYGSQSVVESVAQYRGYDLAPYNQRCGVSTISPADLGKVVWLRIPNGQWFGPCLAMDVAAQSDFYHIVYETREVAEVPHWLSNRLGFKHGRWGEVYMGLCPPMALSLYLTNTHRLSLIKNTPGLILVPDLRCSNYRLIAPNIIMSGGVKDD